MSPAKESDQGSSSQITIEQPSGKFKDWVLFYCAAGLLVMGFAAAVVSAASIKHQPKLVSAGVVAITPTVAAQTPVVQAVTPFDPFAFDAGSNLGPIPHFGGVVLGLLGLAAVLYRKPSRD